MSESVRDREPKVVQNLQAFLGWLPYFGCVAAGVLGLIGAWQAHASAPPPATWPTGGGLYLIGAALAFGLLLNAVLRK